MQYMVCVFIFIIDKNKILILLTKQFVVKLPRTLKNKVRVNMISNAFDERERYAVVSQIIHW